MQLDEGPRDPLDDITLDTGEERDERRSSYWPIAWVVLLLLAALLGVYFGFFRGDKEAPPPPIATSRPETPSEMPAESEAEEPIELPALDASDALVRELVSQLSERPELVSWLATDELVRRFVVAVDNVAEGKSPRGHLPFLDPGNDFRADASGDIVVVDPSGYARYDSIGQLFASLDPAAVARLYRVLRPLCDQAYRELGYPNRRFDDTFNRAVDLLLATPIPQGEVALTEGVSGYEFADPSLESLAPAQKHLLRMGPVNAGRVQRHLRAVRSELGG